jgi:hypothetical protein
MMPANPENENGTVFAAPFCSVVPGRLPRFSV